MLWVREAAPKMGCLHGAGPGLDQARTASEARVRVEIWSTGICCGIHRHERDVGTVVEPRSGSEIASTPCPQQLLHAGGKLGSAGADSESHVAGRKAVEVVNERHGARGRASSGAPPVRRDHEDALRFGHGLGPRGELAHPGRVIEQDGRTMSREDHRHGGVVRICDG